MKAQYLLDCEARRNYCWKLLEAQYLVGDSEAFKPIVQDGHAPSKTSEATSVAQRSAWTSYIQNSHASTQKRLAILSSCAARPAIRVSVRIRNQCEDGCHKCKKSFLKLSQATMHFRFFSSRPLQQVPFELHRGRNASVSRLFVSN